MIEIRSFVTEAVLFTVEADSLQGANLSGASLFQADLSGANLSGAVLVRANLSGANLSCTDMTDASLHGTCLVSANLRDATLVRANLAMADLSHAQLNGANLAEAYLGRTYLFRTDLTDTFLGRAQVREAIFANCRTLHLARGLEEAGKLANGHGYAVLDQRTLRACLEYLPDSFLKNIGYKREEITGLRALYA